jgi:hypothetical protein
MFSKNHMAIWNDRSIRTRLQTYFDSGAKNSFPIKDLFVCFGCKSFTRKDTPHSCPNKTKSLEFVKRILDVKPREPEPKPEAIPDTQAPPLPPEPPKISLNQDMDDALLRILNTLRDLSFNHFVNEMIDIKNFSETESLYHHLFKELDLDVDEFPTEKQDVV